MTRTERSIKASIFKLWNNLYSIRKKCCLLNGICATEMCLNYARLSRSRKWNVCSGNRTRDPQIMWTNVEGKGGVVAQSPRHPLQWVATNIQGLGAATILLVLCASKGVTNEPAWLTCTRYGARLGAPVIIISDLKPTSSLREIVHWWGLKEEMNCSQNRFCWRSFFRWRENKFAPSAAIEIQKVRFKIKRVFAASLIRHAYVCLHVFGLTLPQMTWLRFFP